jgi:hypothetical protein
VVEGAFRGRRRGTGRRGTGGPPPCKRARPRTCRLPLGATPTASRPRTSACVARRPSLVVRKSAAGRMEGSGGWVIGRGECRGASARPLERLKAGGAQQSWSAPSASPCSAPRAPRPAPRAPRRASLASRQLSGSIGSHHGTSASRARSRDSSTSKPAARSEASVSDIVRVSGRPLPSSISAMILRVGWGDLGRVFRSVSGGIRGRRRGAAAAVDEPGAPPPTPLPPRPSPHAPRPWVRRPTPRRRPPPPRARAPRRPPCPAGCTAPSRTTWGLGGVGRGRRLLQSGWHARPVPRPPRNPPPRPPSPKTHS